MARWAKRQHGLVTRVQLLRAGLTSKQVEHRVRIGALIPVHRCVYRVGHAAPRVLATYLAAVLACGTRATLSGLAAAWHLRLIDGRAPVPEVSARGQRR